MKTGFIPTNREQQFLFPPSIQDWLPEDHLARFIVDIISQLDLRPITEAYEGRGKKAYHPEILLALLFYGYATGVFSSRKIEQATYDSVAFQPTLTRITTQSPLSVRDFSINCLHCLSKSCCLLEKWEC